MSVIQNLRGKYAKLTGAIIVIALLGFIFMDLGRSGGSRSTTIGEVNGQAIDMTEYNDRITEQENLYKQQSQGQPLTADQQAQLRDQVWQGIVGEHILTRLREKLGVTITEAEMSNYFTGPNPDPLVKQQFTNPKTGIFNPQEVSVQIQQIKNDPNQTIAWERFTKQIKERHLYQKSIGLLAGAIYIPEFIFKDKMAGMSQVASAKMIKVPYSSVSDKEANVTDEDIRVYIKKHKNRFEVPKASRSIAFISFPLAPSSTDSAKVLNALQDLKEEFASTNDIEGFVNHNSQNASPPQYYTKNQLKILPNAKELMSAAPNTIIGPFYDGNGFELAKVLEKNNLPDSVRTRHILVWIKQGTNEINSEQAAKSKINEAIAALNSGISFDSVALKYSEDPDSKKFGNQGRLITLMQKQSVSDAFGDTFSDFIFEGSTGQSKLVKTETDNYSAYIYVQILKQTTPVATVKLAFVSRELNYSDNTYKTIYNKATGFAANVASSKGKKTFDQIASAHSYQVGHAAGIDKNSYLVNSLGSAKALVNWAYSEGIKIGDVSPVYTVGDQIVVAKLSGIQPKGLLVINDQNRTMLRALVLKDKKAQLILDNYKTKPSSLQAVAQKTHQTVTQLDSFRFNQNFVAGLGNEPKVIGYAFYPEFKLNTVSPAISGNEGVYFISLLSKSKEALAPQAKMQNQFMKQRLMMSLSRSAPQSIIKSMVENADVEDMRSNIY